MIEPLHRLFDLVPANDRRLSSFWEVLNQSVRVLIHSSLP